MSFMKKAVERRVMGIKSEGQSLTPLSGGSPPRLQGPRGLGSLSPLPVLPAALSPVVVCDGACSQGREKSHSHLVQSDQRGLKWGCEGSCVPLDQ